MLPFLHLNPNLLFPCYLLSSSSLLLRGLDGSMLLNTSAHDCKWTSSSSCSTGSVKRGPSRLLKSAGGFRKISRRWPPPSAYRGLGRHVLVVELIAHRTSPEQSKCPKRLAFGSRDRDSPAGRSLLAPATSRVRSVCTRGVFYFGPSCVDFHRSLCAYLCVACVQRLMVGQTLSWHLWRHGT